MNAIRRVLMGSGLLFVGAGLLTASGCARIRHPAEALQPPTVIGSATEAHWTETTWESASTPLHRKTLERGRVVTITGEVVDVSCYLQLGKRGEAHIPCGQKCVRTGQPIGLVTDRGQLYLLISEEHHPRRDGTASLRDRFADLMGRRVTVSGMLQRQNGYRAIFVLTLPKAS